MFNKKVSAELALLIDIDTPTRRRQDKVSNDYDWRLIEDRLEAITKARKDNDILTVVGILRSGLVRNIGNITSPKLFARAYAGTKLLIESYVIHVADAIKYISDISPGPDARTGLTNQTKLDVFHDTRQAFGRSALVLQGGSIFGLCHIGVVKALHQRELLPRIIAGTATGALIAALVAVHTNAELLEFLTADDLDLSAFVKRAARHDKDKSNAWFSTLVRRARRLISQGHLLDVAALEECVRANVGDITFDEAYFRTRRVLNITVSTGDGGAPCILNYLNTPHVVSYLTFIYIYGRRLKRMTI
jgi:TAG lipase/lysophosphatidylethanolamine acyltransferase